MNDIPTTAKPFERWYLAKRATMTQVLDAKAYRLLLSLQSLDQRAAVHTPVLVEGVIVDHDDFVEHYEAEQLWRGTCDETDPPMSHGRSTSLPGVGRRSP